jgi:hypothetical protein
MSLTRSPCCHLSCRRQSGEGKNSKIKKVDQAKPLGSIHSPLKADIKYEWNSRSEQ